MKTKNHLPLLIFSLIGLLLTFQLTGCNLPLEVTPAPGTVSSVAPDPPTATVTPTATPDYRTCGYQWASQTLPDLTGQLVEAFGDANLNNATPVASAYGENCLGQEGQVLYFLAMETDFRITFKVASLGDEAELGRLLDDSLAVLDGFPEDRTPGPLPGYIGITFEDESGGVLNLWFQASRSDELRQQGLSGADLLQALQND